MFKYEINIVSPFQRRKNGEKIVVIFLPSLCKENQQFPCFGTQSEGRVSEIWKPQRAAEDAKNPEGQCV